MGGCTVHVPPEKATEEQKENARVEMQQQIDDANALMPVWYRSSLRPEVTVELESVTDTTPFLTTVREKESVKAEVTYPMLKSVLLLGLIVYPMTAVFLFFREVKSERGLLGKESGRASPPSFMAVLMPVTLGPYLIAFVMAALIYLGSITVCPLFIQHKAYVPFHYALFASQWFVLLSIMMFVFFMYVVRPNMNLLELTRRMPTLAAPFEPRSIRIGHIVQASLKAFFVAACSSLGNQFGLWFGGVAALLVATVLAVRNEA